MTSINRQTGNGQTGKPTNGLTGNGQTGQPANGPTGLGATFFELRPHKSLPWSYAPARGQTGRQGKAGWKLGTGYSV